MPGPTLKSLPYNLRTLCILWAGVLLAGCGALSTHQSPKLLDNQEKVWFGGFGGGKMPGCTADSLNSKFGNGCVLTMDPYIGYRLGVGGGTKDSLGDSHGFSGAEVGAKFSGVPFLGGTMVMDFRLQKWTEPVYLTYDFGVSFFPCLSTTHDRYGEEEEDCGDNPFGGGVFAGATIGQEWLHGGFKYMVGGNTWDGLQLLPGVNIGSALGGKRFKIMPSMDVYFYQWPLDLTPSLRVIYGLGLQASY